MFGWSGSAAFISGGPDAYAVDLGFLGAWPFRRGIPALTYWILLDFLGFSRPNLGLSKSYEGSSRVIFRAAWIP